MQNKFKKGISIVLAVLMLMASVPLGGFVGLSAPVANAEQTSPEELLAWFNDNVNRLKSDDFSQTVTIISGELTDVRLSNFIGPPVIEENFNDEIYVYNPLRKNIFIQNQKNYFPVFGEDFVSSLTVADLQSIQVTDASDVDFLQDLPDTIQSGKNYYDLSLYKKVPVPDDMIRVEITLPAEAVEDGVYTVGNESVSANEIMPSGRFIQTGSLRERYETYPVVQEDDSIYMKNDCNRIERNCYAVWYFDKKTLAPIACKYIYSEKCDQHMYCDVADFSLSFETDLNEEVRNDYIYLFSDYYQISVNTTTDGFQYVVVADKAIIVDYNGSATDLAIPSVIDGYPVTSISYAAFRNCTKLQSVEIPRGITSIGNAAFHNCTKLQSVEIPRGVKSIGDYAFYGCTALEEINIPQGVTSIADYAFYGCTELEAISIPLGVTNIGDYAFYDCTALGAISIPQGVTNIGDYAFYDCTALEEISIPQGVTSIGNYTFYGCTVLTEIDIMQGVTVIGDYAFHDCTVLEEISIPQGVTSIGEYAFNNCTSLTSVTVPDSVTSCGEYAFSGCNSLTAVHISDIAAWCGIAFEDSYSNPLNYAENLYLSGELVTDIVIPNGVTSIGNYAFIGCVSLTSVTVPNSVTSIGNYAFIDCSSLTSVTVPDSVTSIGFFAFYSDASLANITILNPDCVIYDAAFTIPDTATIYGYENSTAQEYAEKYGRSFMALDGENSGDNITGGDISQPETAAISMVVESWEPDEYDGIAVDIYLDNCIGLGGWTFDLAYDADVFSLSDVDCISGSDLTEANRAKNVNPILIAHNTTEDGLLISDGTFREYLWEAEKWAAATIKGTPIAVNDQHFHLLTVYLTVEDVQQFKASDLTIELTGELDFVDVDDVSCTDAQVKKHEVHTWDAGTITQEAKCETNGVKTYTCMRDASHTYTEEIAATGHTEEEIPAVPATCTEGGLTAGVKCSVCDAIFTEQQPIEALGHDEIAHDAQAPTCTAIGWDAYVTCSRCDYTTYEELEALGHDEIAHDAQTPTCTAIGWDAYATCSRCDFTTYKEKAALGHSHKAVVTAPTVTNKGYTTYTCACGDSYVQDYVDPVAGDNAVMKEESVVGLAGTTAKTLLEQVTVGAKLFGMDGKEKAVDARIGTGDKLVLPDGTEIVISVLGDLTGDGEIATSDARLALRKAVNLETFTDAQNIAADADGIDAVTVADARKILRASVNLEKAEDWFKALVK